MIGEIVFIPEPFVFAEVLKEEGNVVQVIWKYDPCKQQMLLTNCIRTYFKYNIVSKEEGILFCRNYVNQLIKNVDNMEEICQRHKPQ